MAISQAERDYFNGAPTQPMLALSPEQQADAARAESAAAKLQAFNQQRARVMAAHRARHAGNVIIECIDHKLRVVYAIKMACGPDRFGKPLGSGVESSLFWMTGDENHVFHFYLDEQRRFIMDGRPHDTAGTFHVPLPADFADYHIVGTQP